jgi:hypothetical protein
VAILLSIDFAVQGSPVSDKSSASSSTSGTSQRNHRSATQGARVRQMRLRRTERITVDFRCGCRVSTGAMAQSIVTTTTTGTGHTTVHVEPEYRTKIKTYITEHKVRPVVTKEKIVVGGTVPSDVELEAVPSDWGPSVTRYRDVYSGNRVMLVDPGRHTVVQEIE